MLKTRFIGLFLSLGVVTVQAEGFADFMIAPAPGTSQKSLQEPVKESFSQPVPSRRQAVQPRQPAGSFPLQTNPPASIPQMRQPSPATATTASLRYMGRFHPMSENLNIDPGLISRWSQKSPSVQKQSSKAPQQPRIPATQADQPRQNQIKPSHPSMNHLPPWQRPIR